MKLENLFELDITQLDKPTMTVDQLADKYKVSSKEIMSQLDRGIQVELEHTNDSTVAKEIALDHLGERLDYYNQLAKIENSKDTSMNNSSINYLPEEIGVLDEVYPGQSSGRLKNYVRKKFGGEITCRKAASLLNDPDTSNFYKKRAKWYKSLHCRGSRQIREQDPMMNTGAALTIWDIDDTLFTTDAKVIVTRPNKPPLRLTKEQHKSYNLKPGEEFDMSEFTNAKLFYSTSKPIENIWRTAKKTLHNIGKRPGSKMVIVTARGDLDDKDMFLNTFKKHGMDMNKVHVYRAGNLKTGTAAKNKQTVIRNLLDLGPYTEVRLFDDDYDNLKAFLQLKNEFPDITFKAYPVHKSGRIGKPIIV